MTIADPATLRIPSHKLGRAGAGFEASARGGPVLRKPFWIAVEGPTPWVAPMVTGLRRLLSQGSVTAPCILLEEPFVGPIVRGLSAGEEAGVLYHQHLVEVASRERQLLDAGDLAYLWLDHDRRRFVDLKKFDAAKGQGIFLGLMGERAVWADVIRLEVDAFPQSPEWEQVVRRAAQSLVQRCRMPAAID
jgi:hypothetical protein